MMWKIFSYLLYCLLSCQALYAQDMVLIKKGNYVPLYGTADKRPVSVNSFYLDVFPVTNQEYLEFLKTNKSYSKSQIKKLFADKSYLAYWKSDLDHAPAKAKSPVTSVSWYAAKKYCESKGKRLPTMDEWEYAAMSDAKTMDARTKKSYNQYILSWYETAKTYNNEVGSTFKNYWGVYDMHGLVWEWTSDFNSIFLTGESRKDKGEDGNLFCGGASVNASDLMNYAAFMRYAFRGSMKASYSSRNLGFRCARDIK
ncbi:formylglycine-generating enzyme family protein [Sphingobacterium mizutaii]|uniref:formylglycine-generating enzyme family protein n=1 Tax=Sphingobacterium mizutaii TaxID=1010 RepID=UPI003D97A684